MANAYRDQNNVPTLIAVSNADGFTPVRLWADPATHRLLVDATGAGGVIVKETPLGLINSSNLVYTLSSTPASSTAILNFSINGQELYYGTDYTWAGTTITFLSALDSSLSGLPFEIVYVTGSITVYTYGGSSTVTAASVTCSPSVYMYRANTASNSITFTLPAAASSAGVTFVFKKISISNSVIIDGNGSETIDGFLTKTLSSSLASLQIYCNGTSWDVIT